MLFGSGADQSTYTDNPFNYQNADANEQEIQNF